MSLISKLICVYASQRRYLVTKILICLVLFSDDEDPVIIDCPDLTTGYLHYADEPSVEVSWLAPTALDNSGNVSLVSSLQPGDNFGKGRTTVTYTASDPSGNEETCSFRVSVVVLPGRPT